MIAPIAAIAATAAICAAAGRDPPPVVNAMTPAGGQRGTEVEVLLRGARLDGAHEVLLLRSGLEVLEVAADRADRCRARLRIRADCPLGGHGLRVCSAHGVANLVVFQVGALAEVDEARGEGVQEVALGTTVNGSIRDDETDRYAVQAAAGQRIVCEVQAMRLGFLPIDLALVVVGPGGEEVLRVDDTDFAHKDPWCAFTAAAAGRHELHVGPAFPDRQNRGAYRLHVGTFPRPVAAVPCGGAPGQVLEVTSVDGERPTRATLALDDDDGSGRFLWFPEDDRGTAPTPVPLRVGGPPDAAPAPDARGRRWLEIPGSVSGVVSEPGGGEIFWFRGKRNRTVEFRTWAGSLRSPLDPLLIVRRADGRYLASDDDGAGAGDSRLRFRVPEDGDYQIEVRDLLRGGSPAHVFRLEVGGGPATMSTSMVVARRQDAVLNVPRGGAAGGVLRFNDADVAAGLAFAAAGLPPGMQAVFGAVRAGTNQVPFLVTAAADAGPAAALASLCCTAGEAGQHRDPGFVQELPLVTVRNDRPILGAIQTALPVATSAAAPFRLELAEPAVPLVRGGAVRVRVRVHRDEGFRARVRVRALWTPPGVGAGRLDVPAGRDGDELLLEANANALLGPFPLAVVGVAGGRNDAFEQASAFATVQVEEPFVTARLGRARTVAGQPAELRLQLEPARSWTGAARAVLQGLPRGVRAEPVAIEPGATEARLRLEVAADAAAGRHRDLRVELLVPHGGGEVVHRIGGGELRIDRPSAERGGGEDR